MLLEVVGVVVLALAIAMLAACGSAPQAGITSAPVEMLW